MRLCFSLLLVLVVVPSAFAQTSVTVAPSQDNTLFESSSAVEARSNGAGIYLFTGNTNRGALRRTLLQFDVAGSVPAGATVDSVRLELSMSKTVAGTEPVSVNRMTTAWGEGTSDAAGEEGRGATPAGDDATWFQARLGQNDWLREGGDFQAVASATTNVAGNGRYAWVSETLTADVQDWLDTPDRNFGWMLLGDESALKTAKRFDSREHPDEARRPSLTIYYTDGNTNVATEDDAVPSTVRLSHAYPNPFQAQTTLRYELDRPEAVTLTVYDLLGRPVATLVEGVQAAGAHTAIWQPEALPNGLYIARLAMGETSYSLSLTLLR
ncbi:MAG: hypothetical protein RhofKO_14170 [Rhodothermales bacterium]